MRRELFFRNILTTNLRTELTKILVNEAHSYFNTIKCNKHIPQISNNPIKYSAVSECEKVSCVMKVPYNAALACLPACPFSACDGVYQARMKQGHMETR